jgi:hypothetical protein
MKDHPNIFCFNRLKIDNTPKPFLIKGSRHIAYLVMLKVGGVVEPDV